MIVLSVTNVIFPRLAKLSASDAEQSFGDTVRATLHSALYVVMPMTAGLMVLCRPRPCVSHLRAAANFGDISVFHHLAGPCLVFPWMPGYTLQTILSRVYFAEQNGQGPAHSRRGIHCGEYRPVRRSDRTAGRGRPRNRLHRRPSR